MGRIIISAAHGGIESGGIDPGVVAGGTTEAREMILTRDLVVRELRSRNYDVLVVPDDLSQAETISWINARGSRDDVALEIGLDGSSNPATRGTAVYYIANNDQRRAHAELLLTALIRRLPQIPSRGARPDTATGLGSLAFTRQVVPPSLYMDLGFLTNPDDRRLLQTRRQDFALAIAEGLAAWSQAVSGTAPPPVAPTYPTIDININGGFYDEQGIIVNGNAYIPVDLSDRIGVDLTTQPGINFLSYRNVVYVKAIDLRDFNVSIAWDSSTRTLTLRSILAICPCLLDSIMGRGYTSPVQMIVFLRSNNENALTQFPDLPKLYQEEANLEGVNYDIAFSQMCVETGFLRFGGSITPAQNNFAGLASATGEEGGAAFPSARIGVRAHIQHLKAYASTQPLTQPVVDPRFNFVQRGIAPTVNLLSRRWSADPQYGDKIIAVLRRLYESAKLL